MYQEVRLLDIKMKINNNYAYLIKEEFDILAASGELLNFLIHSEFVEHFNDDFYEYTFVSENKSEIRILFWVSQDVEKILQGITLYLHRDISYTFKLKVPDLNKTSNRTPEIKYLFKTARELGLGGI